MTISKDFRFGLSVAVDGGSTTISAAGADPISVAVPTEFRGRGGTWSPEHLLVAAAAGSLAVTFVAMAEQRAIPLDSFDVTATGHVGRRDDGQLGFVAIEVTPRIETRREFALAAERTVRSAAAACLVQRALSVPVEVTPLVRVAEPVG